MKKIAKLLISFLTAMLLVVRILIHNGLCLFATWLTIATVVGFSIALIYVDSPGMDTAQLRGKILLFLRARCIVSFLGPRSSSCSI